jgi:hypothetical protein
LGAGQFIRIQCYYIWMLPRTFLPLFLNICSISFLPDSLFPTSFRNRNRNPLHTAVISSHLLDIRSEQRTAPQRCDSLPTQKAKRLDHDQRNNRGAEARRRQDASVRIPRCACGYGDTPVQAGLFCEAVQAEIVLNLRELFEEIALIGLAILVIIIGAAIISYVP